MIYLTPHHNEQRLDHKINETEEKHCIYGKVIDEYGEPLIDACIKIVTTAYDPIIHTVSDCNGQFTLIYDLINPCYIIISKEGYETFLVKTITCPLCITLKKQSISCLLTGRILYDFCQPADICRIRLIYDDIELSTYSNANGRFAFSNLCPGRYQLIIDGNEILSKSFIVYVPNTLPTYNIGSIHVEKIDIKCTIHGIITDTNNIPIHNAVVMLYKCGYQEPLWHTLTNTEGLYFFGNIPTGSYYIDVFY